MFAAALLAHAETEPNDRLALADPLASVPGHAQSVQAEIGHRFDRDCYEVFVREPCLLDLRIVTGAAKSPMTGVGGAGGTLTYTASFLPVVRIFGPDGTLLFVEVSDAPCLFWTDIPAPLIGQSLYIELSALPGSAGVYGLQVSQG